MKWTKLARKMITAIQSGDRETEQKLYAKVDEKITKAKAKKNKTESKEVVNTHIM
jgi:hypothetical protein